MDGGNTLIKRKPGSAGPAVDLRDMAAKGVLAYLAKNPLSKDSCIIYSYDFQHIPRKGEVFALLQQIPAEQRGNITGLDLDYARLADEDLHLIPTLFPTLQEISLGFDVSAEPLGLLMEALPDLQSLGLRRLNMCSLADAHIERLIQATQQGALQKLIRLWVMQTKVSPDVLNAFFLVLPNLRHLIFEGVMLDRHLPMLIQSFQEGPLRKLKEFGMGKATGLSEESAKSLLEVLPGDTLDLGEFLDDEERVKTFDEAIQKGDLRRVLSLNLSHNRNIPPRHLARMLGALPQIQEIELKDMDLTDEHMNELAEQVREGKIGAVKSFQLSQNPRLSIDAVAAVARGFPNLTSLAMEGLDLSGPSATEFATGWKNLEHLCLCRSKLSPQSLRYFVDQKPALKSLDLNDTNLTDDHLAILAQVCREGGLRALTNLSFGGRHEQYSGPALKALVKVLPSAFQGLSFLCSTRLAVEHLKGLYEVAMSGGLAALTGLCLNQVNGLLNQPGAAQLLVQLVCSLPEIGGLGLYAIATNQVLQSLAACKKRGSLRKLEQVCIMESGGILPETLKEIHIRFPEQSVAYFGMGLNDYHAAALAEVAQTDLGGGIYPLRKVELFNADNNPFSARGLSLLMAHLPAVVQLYLSGCDIADDKFRAIAEVRRRGGLLKVRNLIVGGGPIVGGPSPETLVYFLSAFEDIDYLLLSMAGLTDKHLALLAESAERKQALQHVNLLGLGNLKDLNKHACKWCLRNGLNNYEFAGSLSRLLSNLPSLLQLGLNDGLTDVSVAALFPLIERGKWSELVSLNLSSNPRISPKLLATLLRKLRSNCPKMEKVILEKMPFKEEDWKMLIEEGLKINNSS